MIYGASGYTGKLMAVQAVAEGKRVVLAGRNADSVRPLAEKLGVPWRAFPLEKGKIDAGLKGMKLVLHCAGPFSQTSGPMVEACLNAGVHYLDITGEIEVFETIHRLANRAVEAKCVLLPGVGFDVVPSDCLAALLSAKVPGATDLELAFASHGAASPGTLKTAVEGFPEGGRIRRNGKIVRVPAAHETKQIRFSHRELSATSIPWGDVSTAFYSTGIGNITVYSAMPPKFATAMRRFRAVAPLIGFKPVQAFLKTMIEKKVKGPTEAQRLRGKMYLWGRATAPDGRMAEATLDVPEGYRFTVMSSLACVEKVLAGTPAPGVWTPSKAFGASFVETLPETQLTWVSAAPYSGSPEKSS